MMMSNFYAFDKIRNPFYSCVCWLICNVEVSMELKILNRNKAEKSVRLRLKNMIGFNYKICGG